MIFIKSNPNFRESLQTNTPKWILFWVIVTLNANLIGFYTISGISLPQSGIPPYYLLTILLGLIFGAVVGTLQWLVLAVRIPKIKSWIIATTLAYACFLLGIYTLFDLTEQFNSQLALYWGALPEPILYKIANILYGNINIADFIFVMGLNIFFGLVIGIAQWIILRSQKKNSAWWILIHLLCTFFASLFGYRVDGGGTVVNTFFGLYAVFSGVAMDIWFKFRMPENQVSSSQPIIPNQETAANP